MGWIKIRYLEIFLRQKNRRKKMMEKCTPWKSNQPPFFLRLVSEFHHYFSRGENHHPKEVSPFLIWWRADFQGKCTHQNLLQMTPVVGISSLGKHSCCYPPFFVRQLAAGFRGFKLMEINSNGCFPGGRKMCVFLPM